MNETLKKLTDETKASMITALASKAVEALIASTKSATDQDSGSFNVVVSTADMDRQGESVNQNGWDLTFFKMNPIVLWAHDYSSLPIGVCTSIEVKDGKLTAVGKFATDRDNQAVSPVVTQTMYPYSRSADGDDKETDWIFVRKFVESEYENYSSDNQDQWQGNKT